MSGNIMSMHDDDLYSKYFADDLTKAIKDSGSEDFSKAKKLWNRLGLKVTITEEEMINQIVETLSKNLTKGLLQLTVEKITDKKEWKDAVREKKGQLIVMHTSGDLPSFKIYAEFIIKSGLVELKKFRMDFKVEPRIEIEDINVTIQENMVKSVSFGSFKASIALSLLRGEQAVKIVSIEKSLNLPDVHFEHQKELDNRLDKAVEKVTLKAELILPERKIELTEGENTFGRSDFERDIPEKDLVYITKKEDGKYHFLIIKQDGVYYIRDDHSKNGTKLNSIEIKGVGKKELKNGDKITLAGINDFMITLEIGKA